MSFFKAAKCKRNTIKISTEYSQCSRLCFISDLLKKKQINVNQSVFIPHKGNHPRWNFNRIETTLPNILRCESFKWPPVSGGRRQFGAALNGGRGEHRWT